MLGLVGTVGGAVALEVRRWRNKGTVQELNEYKRKERELKQLLEATNAELEQVKQHGSIADERAQEFETKVRSLEQTLEHAKAAADTRIAEISQQKEHLQQNNSKLVLSNLMLMNKAKVLEEHSRTLVERQEDLKHQLEQLQREKQAAETSFETSFAALKDQVTAVLNRYFSKDIDLQQAVTEMQGLGIEVVPVNDTDSKAALEFETKLVLESPHRMQRLMGSRTVDVSSLTSDLPQLTFPMGISRDPTTGVPRITLAWRTDPQQQKPKQATMLPSLGFGGLGRLTSSKASSGGIARPVTNSTTAAPPALISSVPSHDDIFDAPSTSKALSKAVITTRPFVPVSSQRCVQRHPVQLHSTAPGFEKAMFGEDWGARDPTPGELGSNFGEKIVMNWDTEHIIKPPDAMGEHIGLRSRKCRAPEETQLLDDTLRERLRQQVPGWRIQSSAAGIQCIRQEWTAKDAQAAQQLLTQLQQVAQQNGHPLSHGDVIGSTVVAELTTSIKGGLTENDFIVAALINDTDVSQLLQKRKARYWA
eukprot:gene4129-4376_t